MNKMEQNKIKEVPIWTAQMLDMTKLKVLDKVMFNTNEPAYMEAPDGTKRVIVIYLG